MADAENDSLNDAKDDQQKENEEGNKDEQGSESTPRNSQNEVRLEVKRVKDSFKNNQQITGHKFAYITFKAR